MDQEGIDPSQYPDYPSLMKSGNISERYWLARILGNGREEKTYLDLIRMLDDPSPNVVCMALRSLGKRGNEQAAAIILNRMKSSDHWYIQWYAYNALKNLKWRQHGLN
ncbi:MAG: HEAT repeat domain-containing protein, partial [Thermodesulfobacteriota bacterium]|nr:HEAT repeat domain-containing protein [Thermodesulfobacteriota bacterium]